jgi:hypothetical protein
MCAVVVPPTSEQPLKDALASIKTAFGIPIDQAFHWNEHCAPRRKNVFDRRMFVATTLAGVPDVMLNYVIFEKSSIPDGASIAVENQRFYNYVAGITLERIILSTQYLSVPDRSVQARFGHVRGFDHASTLDYFKIKRNQPNQIPNYDLLYDEPKFVSAQSNGGIQVADAYLGIMRSALEPNKYGQYQHQHLQAVSHQIRRSPRGVAWAYGMKVLGLPDFRTRYPWWKDCIG